MCILLGDIKTTFIVRIFKAKKVFYFVILFVILQIFFTVKGIQNFPFFLYGMYSEKVVLHKNYKLYVIYVNDEKLYPESFYSYNYQTFRIPLEYYILLSRKDSLNRVAVAFNKRFKDNISKENFNLLLGRITNDDLKLNEFVFWFSSYLQSSINEEIKGIKIVEEVYSIQSSEIFKINEDIIYEF